MPHPKRPTIRALSLLVALAAALPAVAQQSNPMSAAEFEAFTTGRTLTFNFADAPYGIEQYLPGRRVRWAFMGQECQDGVWYERNGNICFLYEHAPTDEQCWSFTTTETGLRGVFQGPDGPSTELYSVQESNAPMECTGPGLGV